MGDNKGATEFLELHRLSSVPQRHLSIHQISKDSDSTVIDIIKEVTNEKDNIAIQSVKTELLVNDSAKISLAKGKSIDVENDNYDCMPALTDNEFDTEEDLVTKIPAPSVVNSDFSLTSGQNGNIDKVERKKSSYAPKTVLPDRLVET